MDADLVLCPVNLPPSEPRHGSKIHLVARARTMDVGGSFSLKEYAIIYPRKVAVCHHLPSGGSKIRWKALGPPSAGTTPLLDDPSNTDATDS
jgi:hypothetical protein